MVLWIPDLPLKVHWVWTSKIWRPRKLWRSSSRCWCSISLRIGAVLRLRRSALRAVMAHSSFTGGSGILWLAKHGLAHGEPEHGPLPGKGWIAAPEYAWHTASFAILLSVRRFAGRVTVGSPRVSGRKHTSPSIGFGAECLVATTRPANHAALALHHSARLTYLLWYCGSISVLTQVSRTWRYLPRFFIVYHTVHRTPQVYRILAEGIALVLQALDASLIAIIILA
jgi:hypothetical protein